MNQRGKGKNEKNGRKGQKEGNGKEKNIIERKGGGKESRGEGSYKT